MKVASTCGENADDGLLRSYGPPRFRTTSCGPNLVAERAAVGLILDRDFGKNRHGGVSRRFLELGILIVMRGVVPHGASIRDLHEPIFWLAVYTVGIIELAVMRFKKTAE